MCNNNDAQKVESKPQHASAVDKEWTAIVSKIRQRRVQLGWTQSGLAEKLDCEITTIQAYEQKRRHPSTPTLLMLCKILKLKLSVD